MEHSFPHSAAITEISHSLRNPFPEPRYHLPETLVHQGINIKPEKLGQRKPNQGALYLQFAFVFPSSVFSINSSFTG